MRMVRVKFKDSKNDAVGFLELSKRLRVICLPEDTYEIPFSALAVLDTLTSHMQLLTQKGLIMPLERYEILLPLKYNDGSPVEPEKFQQTRRELIEKFGAVTVEPQSVHGIWTHGSEEYADELIRFIVDIETTSETEKFFKELKERLKIRFQQIEIWITAHPIRLI